MRIQPVSVQKCSFWLRCIFRIMGRSPGGIPAPLKVYGWKPWILLMFLGLGKAARRPGLLPERLKRLAMYWTARQVECAF